MRNKIKQIQTVEMIATPKGDTVGIVNNINFIKVDRKCLKDSEHKLSSKTGVYFLCKVNSLELYIGETVDMFKRLSTHDSNKDFWDYAICFSSDMLTKTTSVYLERNLIAKASKVGFELQNTSSGFSQPISFLDETKCEVVIDSISMIMDMLHEKEASMLGEEPVKVKQCETRQNRSIKEQIKTNSVITQLTLSFIISLIFLCLIIFSNIFGVFIFSCR